MKLRFFAIGLIIIGILLLAAIVFSLFTERKLLMPLLAVALLFVVVAQIVGRKFKK
jgi:uncharacterized membrane protein YukC